MRKLKWKWTYISFKENIHVWYGVCMRSTGYLSVSRVWLYEDTRNARSSGNGNINVQDVRRGLSCSAQAAAGKTKQPCNVQAVQWQYKKCTQPTSSCLWFGLSCKASFLQCVKIMMVLTWCQSEGFCKRPRQLSVLTTQCPSALLRQHWDELLMLAGYPQ